MAGARQGRLGIGFLAELPEASASLLPSELWMVGASLRGPLLSLLPESLTCLPALPVGDDA